jgi:glycosyltransferase involved in cell wall biosynthesis
VDASVSRTARVAFVSPGGNAQGGAERSLAALVDGLVADGHPVLVHLLDDGDFGEVVGAMGAEVVVDRASSSMRSIRRHGSTGALAVAALRAVPGAIGLGRRVGEVAAGFRADIIHSNGFRSHVLAPILATRRIPLVWSLRDFVPSRTQQAILDAASVPVAAMLANSHFTGAQMRVHRSRVHVVGNPVTLDTPPPREAARAALGLPFDRSIALVAAHFHSWKGHDVAIRAIARVPEDQRPMLAIAGGDLYGDDSRAYRDELVALIASLGVEEDVRLLGGISDMATTFGAADVFVHAARRPEGFGRVIVEAWLAGLPVVATGLGGVLELVEPGVTGILVPPDDPDAIAAALETVLGDATVRARLVAGGRAKAASFTPRAHVDAVEAVYATVGGRRG